MLIRSQNKMNIYNLDNIRKISVEATAIIVDSCPVLGAYSTQEKALKVLDMIQDAYLKCNREHLLGNFGFVQNFVFQMPSDENVEV